MLVSLCMQGIVGYKDTNKFWKKGYQNSWIYGHIISTIQSTNKSVDIPLNGKNLIITGRNGSGKMKTTKSVEERVEDCGKRWLDSYKCEYYTKTASINTEIDMALKNAPSKQGGTGGNYPDIRLLLKTKNNKTYPVLIEVKGTKNKLQFPKIGTIDNMKDKGEPNYAAINSCAVNGAVHYAQAVIAHTKSYKEVIAIGLNGYEEAGELKTELGVYYVSAENYSLPKEVETYSDLSFLAPKNFDDFIKEVENLKLTKAEKEKRIWDIELQMEWSLRQLNESMHHDLNIAVSARVQLITGMIMAGLGVPGGIVTPLEVSELKGQAGQQSHDGAIIINKVKDFLTERKLPQEKKEMIANDLSRVFVFSNLWKPQENDESKLKTVYIKVKKEILPIFTSRYHLDFTGKLFNVLNEWVDVPDGGRNDVVLTPRYVTEMMAKLAKVDCNSYVWDYAAGSGGFLISAMKLMIEDAKRYIHHSPEELQKKILNIKIKQLLGIEKLPDMYLLAVLNMILMEDGSTSILHKNSLTEYEGKYEQGEDKEKDFPANVFLLNPPYSADGKGFVFVKKALSRMTSGRAVILIQENAGAAYSKPIRSLRVSTWRTSSEAKPEYRPPSMCLRSESRTTKNKL